MQEMSAPFRALMATSAVMVGGVALIGGAGTALASAHGNDDHKVSICHVTASDKNPYNLLSVDAASVIKDGHGDHSKNGRTDIIPPFSYVDTKGNAVSYPGKGDQSILANGCEVDAPSTTTKPPTTEAPTTEAPKETVAPTTEAPTTEAPTTEAPTTEAPTTEAPKRPSPTCPRWPVRPPATTTPRRICSAGPSWTAPAGTRRSRSA